MPLIIIIIIIIIITIIIIIKDCQSYFAIYLFIY